MDNIERSCGVDTAISTARDEIRRLSLQFKLVQLGDRTPSYRCSLFDQTGAEVSVGNGKGRGKQAQASALFEALEHLTSLSLLDEAVDWVPIAAVASGSLAGTEKVIQLLQKHAREAKIPCRLFTSISGESTVHYPLFLTQPGYGRHPLPGDTFDYRLFSKYATNNGSAIGVTEVEALIHGICELVERDAVSCFLLRAFLTQNNGAVRVVDIESLPLDYINLIQGIEESTGGRFTLVDITGDLGVPACMAILRDDRSILPHVGSGASLHYGYALERAVLEAQQSLHLHTHDMELESTAMLSGFARLDRYRNCLTLDLSNRHADPIPYEALPDHNVPGQSLGRYLSTLTQLISDAGFAPYYAANYRGEGGVTCVQCLIPGLEKFHLVREGMAVLPSERGMRLVKAG